MQTFYLLGVSDAQKNHMFEYSYTHNTYYYIITTMYAIVSGVVMNVE